MKEKLLENNPKFLSQRRQDRQDHSYRWETVDSLGNSSLHCYSSTLFFAIFASLREPVLCNIMGRLLPLPRKTVYSSEVLFKWKLVYIRLRSTALTRTGVEGC